MNINTGVYFALYTLINQSRGPYGKIFRLTFGANEMRSVQKLRFEYFLCGSNNLLTLNRPSFLQIGMAEGGQILPPPPLCNFCLNGPIDLKLCM